MMVADGRPSLRLEVTSARPSTVFTSARMVSLAALSTAGSAADTRTSSSDMPPPAEESSPVTVMVPAFWSLATCARTLSMMAFLSASGSVVMANVAWLADALVPPPAPNRLPVLPAVYWKISTPAVSLRIASTLLAATCVASRLEPGGNVCVTLMVFCPELSNRLVLSIGPSIIVPANTANAATRVTILWSTAHRSAGR